MTTQVDGKSIIFSTSFLVGNDREALINVPLQGDILRLGITFKSGTPAEERTGTWHHENGIVKFAFSGWNNPLGTCVQEPTKFGDVGEKRMYFQLAHHMIGDQNFAHLFILIGE